MTSNGNRYIRLTIALFLRQAQDWAGGVGCPEELVDVGAFRIIEVHLRLTYERFRRKP